ncbi:hypothetical protein BHM03_00038514 [Ensete ventricosum]|nr:hypothetical protein BHM03_00038514 [Ensete ventricosum]
MPLAAKSARSKPSANTLLGLSQKDDEPLSHFVARFFVEIRAVPDAHPSLIIQVFLIMLRLSRFFWLLIERPSTVVAKKLQHANHYTIANSVATGKREKHKRPYTEKS